MQYEQALAAVLANRDTIYKAPWGKAVERMTEEHNAMCVALRPELPGRELDAITSAAEALALRLGVEQ
jgi:hypothetical protein